MYRVFVYGYSFESGDFYITDEFKYNTFAEAMSKVAFFGDNDLYEITKDVFIDITCLKPIARSASLRAFINTYYSR